MPQPAGEGRVSLVFTGGSVCAVPVHESGRSPSRWGFSTLFLVHGMSLAAWFVPLSPVLEAHGYGNLRPYAFATSAVAAFVTPLWFGALADRRHPPLRVLRGVALAMALFMALASVAIARRWPAPVVLGLIQLQALLSTPTWSLVTSIVLGGLRDARREFGPVRAFGTFGWIAGCLGVSALGADASPQAGYLAATLALGLAGFTWAVPAGAPPGLAARVSLRERMGLDALELLRRPESRGVLLTAGMLSAPLAAFYPFTPAQLHDLGLVRISAWMSLAQVTEVGAMFGLAALLARWRFKWVLAAGLGFAVARYLLLAGNGRPTVLVGVSLHGLAFTLFYVSAPIYLNHRIEPAWRARAQALLVLLTQGCGNLVGYLGTGAWLALCQGPGGTRWSLFWGGLAACVIGVAAYFLAVYRDTGRLRDP